jgi:hypothetical protein
MLWRNVLPYPPESVSPKMEAVHSSKVSEQTKCTVQCKNQKDGRYINNTYLENPKTFSSLLVSFFFPLKDNVEFTTSPLGNHPEVLKCVTVILDIGKEIFYLQNEF